jgi:hypothetical protein
MKSTSLLAAIGFLAAPSLSHAAVFQFDLVGLGGSGLIAANEVTAGGATATILGTPGFGGETGLGISYDDVANVLTLNFFWSGLQGATAGSVGSASGYHIHGPVTTPNPFLSTAAVLHNVSANTAGGGAIPNYVRVNNPDGTGSVSGTISNLPSGQVADLLAGKWYVNVHSSLNTGGEIRGNLVVVPEVSSTALAAMGLLCLARRRR